LVNFFHNENYILTEMGWGTFWASFPQTQSGHPAWQALKAKISRKVTLKITKPLIEYYDFSPAYTWP
jgi:hypothetical protein